MLISIIYLFERNEIKDVRVVSLIFLFVKCWYKFFNCMCMKWIFNIFMYYFLKKYYMYFKLVEYI